MMNTIDRCVVFGILVVMSILLLIPILPTPCAGGSLQMHDGLTGPMCHQHEMADPSEHDTATILAKVIPRRPLDFFALVLAATYLFLSKKELQKKLPPNVIYRMGYLRWIWSRLRPFSSMKKFIPFFAPMRDA